MVGAAASLALLQSLQLPTRLRGVAARLGIRVLGQVSHGPSSTPPRRGIVRLVRDIAGQPQPRRRVRIGQRPAVPARLALTAGGLGRNTVVVDGTIRSSNGLASLQGVESQAMVCLAAFNLA
ncbi:hypothetical protein DPM13_14875 [Paracoccus mutanolyticus]|uniref:Uncharacterized protein n=1 Tax=Paracoccus mutanolyticus TaxID=1499308 RepID=A0ABM6WTI6_9RHOB|nr:hypothetical protein DPM13_14875 [Paracoccus mutanolyticus]